MGKAFGGAISNSSGNIGDITGDFSGNYAKSDASYAQGGAIYNDGIIGDITGDFTDNYAQSTSSYAQGGAIYNYGAMTLTNSSFYDNYVQTNAEKDSLNGRKTQGGAIYSESDLTVRADAGESIFRGNKVIWGDGEEESSGIYMTTNASSLALDSRNNGLIQFDDKIKAVSSIDEVLQVLKDNGATITDDGNGGYIIEQDGQKTHLENGNGTFWALAGQDSMEKNDVEEMLLSLNKWEVK